MVQQLVLDYPVTKSVLVMDNLHPASLYEAFTVARRIAERLEIHYTPKHGSWMNLAEMKSGGPTMPEPSHSRPGGPAAGLRHKVSATGMRYGWSGVSLPPTRQTEVPLPVNPTLTDLLVVRIGTGALPNDHWAYAEIRRVTASPVITPKSSSL